MEVILQIWQEVNVLLHLLLRISHFQLQKTAKRKLFEKSEIQYPECDVGKLYATHVYCCPTKCKKTIWSDEFC